MASSRNPHELVDSALFILPERLRKLLDQATKELKADLKAEGRPHSEAKVRKAVETAFNELGSVDLISLISRANAILLLVPVRIQSAVSDNREWSVCASSNRQDSGRGSRVPSNSEVDLDDDVLQPGGDDQCASTISVEASTLKAMSGVCTPTSARSHLGAGRILAVPSVTERTMNESSVFNRSIPVANRSTSLVKDYLMNVDSPLKCVVKYIMWRTNLPEVYENDVSRAAEVLEAAMVCRDDADFRKWRDAAYEAWTHVLPVSIKLAIVLNNLRIGSLDSARENDFESLKEHSITHLVVYTEMPNDDEKFGVDPVKEFGDVTPEGILVHVVPQTEFARLFFSYDLLAFIHEGRQDDHAVAIVCDSDGLTAAGLILAVYLMLNNDRQWDTALQAVKGAHGDFAPSRDFVEEFSKKAPVDVPTAANFSKWHENMRPSGGVFNDDPTFQEDESMFQGCLRDYRKWFVKMQKLWESGKASDKDKKMFDDWMVVRTLLRDESTERSRSRRNSFFGMESQAATPLVGRTSRANSLCGSPRVLFGVE